MTPAWPGVGRDFLVKRGNGRRRSARGGAAGAHFRSIAENVAMAPSPQALEQEWMHSTPHRNNILDPHMNAIGVGLVKQGGNYYAVEDFADTDHGRRHVRQRREVARRADRTLHRHDWEQIVRRHRGEELQRFQAHA